MIYQRVTKKAIAKKAVQSKPPVTKKAVKKTVVKKVDPEIATLTAENKELREAIDMWASQNEGLKAVIKKLKKKLKRK